MGRSLHFSGPRTFLAASPSCIASRNLHCSSHQRDLGVQGHTNRRPVHSDARAMCYSLLGLSFSESCSFGRHGLLCRSLHV
jgi:hypothetical protein